MKKSIYSILIICLVIMTMIISNKVYYDSLLKESEDKYINNIIMNIDDENITKEFLIWVNTKYNHNSLVEINNYISNGTYSKNIWHSITGYSYYVLMDMYQNKYNDMENVRLSNRQSDTISFVGDVSLADNWYIMPKYDERNKGIYGILSKDIVDIMKNSAVTIANNEFTIGNRGEKLPGKYYTFRADPKRLSIYHEMGVNLVTLANNHVYDYGKASFVETIINLKNNQIPYIGAGLDIEEAKKPYYYIINGYKFAFVNATRAEKNVLTPEATIDDGGVFRCYNPDALVDLIKNTKEDSDYVITLIHWGKEDSQTLENVQIENAKLYIDAGSDAIIGTHAHVLQGIEFYQNKPIVYNLGDFIFNNETKDTGIFQMRLKDDGNFEYYFIPALEKDEYTSLLKENEKQRVIDNMNLLNINAIIDSEGKIIEKAQ